jgi:hypothetical protein
VERNKPSNSLRVLLIRTARHGNDRHDELSSSRFGIRGRARTAPKTRSYESCIGEAPSRTANGRGPSYALTRGPAWDLRPHPRCSKLSLLSHADSRSTAIPRRRRPAADGGVRCFRVGQAAIQDLVAASRDHRLSACGRPCPHTGHEVVNAGTLNGLQGDSYPKS